MVSSWMSVVSFWGCRTSLRCPTSRSRDQVASSLPQYILITAALRTFGHGNGDCTPSTICSTVCQSTGVTVLCLQGSEAKCGSSTVRPANAALARQVPRWREVPTIYHMPPVMHANIQDNALHCHKATGSLPLWRTRLPCSQKV
jgi:hypothetical protein